MSTSAAQELVSDVAHAHAAHTLAGANHLAVSFSSGGAAFAVKRQRTALTCAEALLSPMRQQALLTGDLPRPWAFEVRDSDELRRRLDRLRGAVRWDPQDVAAFAAGALWTYLMIPLLLADADHVERLPDAGGLRRLKVTLPSSIAGHESTQTLHVGATGLISRHDYTATAFSARAHAAQMASSYLTFDGVPIATRRRVTPRIRGRRLWFPELVWIDIHDVRLG